jgi:hypothetical protein
VRSALRLARRVLPLLAVIVSGAFAFIFGSHTSAANLKRKQAERDLSRMKKATKVEREVHAMDRDELRTRADDWVRKN